MRLFFICVVSVTLLFYFGCGRENFKKSVVFVDSFIPKESWYKRQGWKAEDYFDDPKIIAFCNAIEKGDIETMNKLIAEGVDVNTKGKDAMSPVFWSFYAGDKVFEKVLAAGGDPNYVIGGDPNFKITDEDEGAIQLGKRLHLRKGWSLLFMAVSYRYGGDNKGKHDFYRRIDILMEYGANPEIGTGTPNPTFAFLHSCLGDELFDEKLFNEKKLDGFLQQCIDYETDLNTNRPVIDERTDSYPNPCCEYYVTTRAARNCRFNAAILLLESGATYDTTTIPGGELQRILFGYKTTQFDSDDTEKDYQRLVKWLEDHGVSFDKPVPKEVSTKKPEPVRKKPKMVPNEE